MKKFLLGAAVGYVLGARAGRGRYEQILRLYRKVVDHPAVQEAAGVAKAKVSEKIPGPRHDRSPKEFEAQKQAQKDAQKFDYESSS